MLVSLIYVFKQVLSANLDLFYILSLILLIKSLIKKEKYLIKLLYVIYIILFYTGIQIIFLNTSIDLIRYFVSSFKLILNFNLLFYIIKKIKFININKIIKNISYIFFIILVFALILRNNNILWRLNDYVNTFEEVRLRFFYYEPSELGFQVAIIIIIFIFKIYTKKIINKKDFCIIIFLSIILSLTSAYGAIISLMLALIPILFKSFKLNSYKKLLIAYSIILISIVIIYLNFYKISDSYIVQRGLSIISGEDGSVNYRFDIGLNIMINALKNTNLLGVGLSNANTDNFIIEYSNFGLVEVIANSFMYVITELGVLAVVFLVYLLIKCLISAKINNSILKLSLIIYIFSYQIAGGYFSNPTNWIIYGIILSNIKDEELFGRKD